MKRILLWAFFICLANVKTFAQVNSTDSLALVDFYHNTQGASWAPAGWLQPGNPVANWHGITVTGNRVTEINLETVTGTGSIPASIGDLDALKLLSIRYNNLTGTLPSSIGTLSQLETLTIMQDFDMGQGTGLITGTIPISFAGLTNLKNLTLVANGFSGSFPMVLTQLTQLQSLHLGRNQFTGPIPDEIGNLSMLQSLSLHLNAFSGTIPSTIGNLTNLSSLDLGSNQLSGSIPTVISNLGNLNYFNIYDNQLAGPIPPPVCSLFLTQTSFNISKNKFNFDHLECVSTNGQSTSAPHVRIYGPQSSPILNYDDTELSVTAGGQLSKNTYRWFRNGTQVALTTGDSTYNTISAGNYYVSVTNTDVKDLSLQSTNFTIASVPILESDSLALLDFFSSTQGPNWANKTNWLVPGKSISEWYGVTTTGNRVTRLEFQNNNMVGPIPESFGSLDELTYVWLFRNDLTGSIPTSIGNLVKLTYLDLQQNNFNGSIPESIGALENLERLDLAFCKLSGAIPQTLGNLASLKHLNLSVNNFEGSIPHSFEDLNNLEILGLSANKLSGTVEMLCSLPKLKTFTFDQNFYNFDGIECVQQAMAAREDYNLSYSPQARVTLNHTDGELSLTAGGTLANNTYKWFRNNQEIASQPGDSTLSLSLPGIYYATVTNSIATSLTLQTTTFTLRDEAGLRQDSLALVALYNSAGGAEWIHKDNWLQPGIPISEWYGVTLLSDRVVTLQLPANNLTGELPESLGDLNELGDLDLSGNYLYGSIPQSIGNASKLYYLRLRDNQLTGSIPASINGMQNLYELEIQNNQLSGSLPGDMSQMIYLNFIDASNNLLSGSIPATFANLPELWQVLLHNNELSGTIPEFANEKGYLMVLNLGHNKFNGPVPASLVGLSDLILLDNQLTFDGLETLVPFYNGEFPTLDYSPQALIPLTNNNPRLSVSAGGTLSKNTYTWFKDGGEIEENKGDSTFIISEPGTYYVEVRNDVATDLVLSSAEVVITVVESEGTLPLDFVDVRATGCASGACIEWKTSNEHNTSHFEVEASTNGNNFKKLGNNVSSWNSPGVHSYNAADENPAAGYNYYRIKQVDKDGVYKYSKTVSVNISVSGNILAAPNPTTGSFMLKGLDKADRISLYNVNGQLLKQWQNINGNKQLSIANLNNGLYIIKIDEGKKQTILRLLKQ